jgi:KH domain-containing protein
MQQFYCENTKELRKQINLLEKRLDAKISIQGKKVTIDTDAIHEYEASLIIDAINLGFPAEIAALLEDENYSLEIINIKDFSRKKNLTHVRSRLIGAKGRTKHTIEQISGCHVKIKRHEVGIIGPAENIEHAITGITNLIRGTKQSNVYKFLEKINTKNKKFR